MKDNETDIRMRPRFASAGRPAAIRRMLHDARKQILIPTASPAAAVEGTNACGETEARGLGDQWPTHTPVAPLQQACEGSPVGADSMPRGTFVFVATVRVNRMTHSSADALR